MSIKSRFCVRCGKETETVLEGLCHPCYLEERPVQIPREIEVKICPKCGAVFLKKVWINIKTTPEEQYLNELKAKTRVPEHAKLSAIEILEDGKFGKVRLGIIVKGTLVPIEKGIALIHNKFCCPDCSRHASDWATKIQLRSHDVIDAEEFASFIARYRDDIIRTKQQKRGMDILFFKTAPANKLANDFRKAFNAKIIRSYEQHGHNYDTGFAKYREVILVKL